MTITNRLPQLAKVFIRHTVNKGWKLIEAPPAFERVGDAHLFEVDLKPGESKDVEIAEATPIERTLDLNADVTLDMMKVYVDAPEGTPELKDQLKKLLGDPQEARRSHRRSRTACIAASATTASAWTSCTADHDADGGEDRRRPDEPPQGQDEGDLAIACRSRRSRSSITEEKIMLTRVQFQDALAELTLPDATQQAAMIQK